MQGLLFNVKVLIQSGGISASVTADCDTERSVVLVGVVF